MSTTKMDSPVTTLRTDRNGHDQNKRNLQRDMDIGLSQFRPIVEIIRIHNLDDNMTGRLIHDFKKFRDIMAHKGVDDIIFYQMMVAFVMYCRGIFNLQPITHEPASTTGMSTTFARMADINVAICAGWFLYVLQKERDKRQNIVRWMTKLVENSSFAQLTFIADEHSEEILITDGVETERKRFNAEWLKEVTRQVQNSTITYRPDEEAELTQCYQDAESLM